MGKTKNKTQNIKRNQAVQSDCNSQQARKKAVHAKLHKNGTRKLFAAYRTQGGRAFTMRTC